MRDEQPHITVVMGESAVLGKLRAARVNKPRGRDRDEIRGLVVFEWVLRERRQFGTSENLDDAERSLLRLQIMLGRSVASGLRALLEPDQCDIVGLKEIDAGRRAVGAVIDSLGLRKIDRRLAMLGGDDDQRTAVEMLGI